MLTAEMLASMRCLFAAFVLCALCTTAAAAEEAHATQCPLPPVDGPAPEKMPYEVHWPKERLRPMRDEIIGIFHRARQLVREKCEEPGVIGTAMVAVEISGRTGKARTLAIAGIERPATIGCITTIVNGLRVRPFKEKVMRLKYPFKLDG